MTKAEGKRLRREREQRMMDAIRLKKTDRVPVITTIGYLPAKMAGIPCSAAYYDYDAWYDAYRRALPHFPADMIYTQYFTPGRMLEILRPHQSRWPGYNCNPNFGHQTEEIDNMRGDEYDAYIEDSSDYMFRTHLSRVSDELTGLAKLPHLSDVHGAYGAQMLAGALADPEAGHALETLCKAGRELRKWRRKLDRFQTMIDDFGYPRYFQGAAMPPFDLLSHSLRGMAGTMQDMFRRPEKITAITEKILEQTLARPVPPPSENGHIRMFMTNTRGSDDFMSTKHFDKFYWPTFKKLVLALVERGMTPCIFFEGDFTSRVEYLREFPKGSILVKIDTTDIYKARKVLGGHLCIEGNVPSSLLQVGTVQQVRDYCKEIIDLFRDCGGLIVGPRSSTDEVKPENLRTMIEFSQEYGVYK